MKKNDLIGLGLLVAGVALCYFTLWGLILVVAGLATCSFYTIPQGYYGYILVLEKNIGKAHSNGWGLKVPFLSTITYVSTETYPHKECIHVQNFENTDIEIPYTLKFKFSQRKAHLLKQRIHSLSQKEYAEKLLRSSVIQALSIICSPMTVDDIKDGLESISQQIPKKLPVDEFVEIECIELGNPDYPKEIEEANQKLARIARDTKIADAETALIEKKGQNLVKAADYQKEADIKKAEGEAQAMKIKGDSENEVKERLGEILKSHPELIKEALAKNFPKVFGGNSMINLNDLLGS